jgi:dipeptidase E
MKLILTSTGFENPNLSKKFLKLVKKSPSEIKILFIPIAARTKEELKYVKESKQELLNLGIKKIIELKEKIDYSKIKDFDAVYICGGNTFYLLNKFRKLGFDKLIKRFVKNGKVFVGVSAGSIIAGPNIEIASPFDKNKVNLKNLTGLNLIDVVVSPHYCKKEERIIENFKKKSKYKVIPLTDKQALLVLGNKIKIIQ